ncbi:exosortase C-terminal domain/associated protein EpsI [Candidatus Thiodiazotropha sp. CDECU1]|uniref:exosortase C-terminal domain/associated protein EpsI n=1 Tax=Candidatus Thiodiazotropha sp. CDECU1 TaxID=3065865 RepID=UPI002930C113|nr:exosortase C-terminal domain/associated protein EpsI [Candidatus Thiodiazotropha sp. CDECU1]
MHKPASLKFTISDISLFFGIAIIFVFYNKTAVSIYNNWTAENSLYTHGLLLLPISLFLFYNEWKSTRDNFSIKFRPFSALLLISLSILWFISESIHIQISSQILFILILCFYIYSLFGIRQTLRLSFTILILLSSVPLWSIFSAPLQLPTAIIVDHLLKLTGYTSFQESFYIHIPEGIFEIGDTCSGLRYQIAAITTTILYVFFSKYTLKISIICIIIASIVAFISNVIRIYIVVLSGHYTNMTHSLLEDHIWLGWLVFGIFFLAYLVFLGRIDNRLSVETRVTTSHPISPKPQKTNHVVTSILPIILIALISIGPIISLSNSSTSNTNIKDIKLESQLDGWNQITATKKWKPTWQPSDYEILTSYSYEHDQVDLFLSTFLNQRQGKELINDLNLPYETGIWKIEKTNTTEIVLESGDTYKVKETLVVNQYMQKRLIWHWYYIGGKVTHDNHRAKLLGIINILTGRKDESVFIISSQFKTDIENTRRILKDFFHGSFYYYQGQLDNLNI